MVALTEKPSTRLDDAVVLTKAVLRAADKLGVNGAALAPVLGVSEATVSRMKSSLVAWRRVGRHSPFGFVIMRGE
jgi:hypothetical protein